MEVLRADPDADTVRALDELAAVEAFADTPDANQLSAEALTLGQALDVDTGQLADLFTTRGNYLNRAGRRPEAVSYYREAARLATQVGDDIRLGRALLNLANVLTATDPIAAAEAARTAAAHLRRLGARDYLAYAIANLAGALLELGDWDAAEAELTRAANADGLADIDLLTCQRAWLDALRGDAATAGTILTGLTDLRASEDIQDKATISITEALTAEARRQPGDALRCARAALAQAGAIGISHDCLRWAWPLAARAACDLDDTAATGDLLALLDSYQPGQLGPMLRAERDLARGRLAARHGDQAAAPAFAAAISSVREHSTPYHLAHGLLDHAGYLARLGDAQAAAAAIGEAREVAGNLRCQPLPARAADIATARISGRG